ncbi:MAG: PorT family protein [Saprospiraceae bacterium]|nr:PorT family protein [Saprospiraceae bacterium]MBK7738598.1 PorT family protein [Saprospiraceae bacterium]MBK7912830.1 PorT family protein [Saprospiraceae bacterium]
MKNTIIFTFLLGLCCTQNGIGQRFFIGANAALQSTWIFSSTDFDEGGLLNFESTIKSAYGFYTGYQLNAKFGMESGAIYSFQGQRYVTEGNSLANYKTNLEYLKIPLLFNYQTDPSKKFSIVSQIGFQFSVLLNAESSRAQVFGPYSPKLADVKDFYNSLPIELVLGLGVQMNFSKYAIRLLIRPDYSLTDIEKTDKKPGLRSPSSNFTFGLPQVGFHFKL